MPDLYDRDGNYRGTINGGHGIWGCLGFCLIPLVFILKQLIDGFFELVQSICFEAWKRGEPLTGYADAYYRLIGRLYPIAESILVKCSTSYPNLDLLLGIATLILVGIPLMVCPMCWILDRLGAIKQTQRRFDRLCIKAGGLIMLFAAPLLIPASIVLVWGLICWATSGALHTISGIAEWLLKR